MNVYIPIQLQRRIRELFSNCCAYCQTAEHLTATVFEFEHIVPRSAGGSTCFENLCLSCPMCNRYKRDLTSAINPHTTDIVPLFNPQKDLWIDHFAWNDDHTEVVGLTDVGIAMIDMLHMNRPAMIRVRKMWVVMGEHPPDMSSAN